MNASSLRNFIARAGTSHDDKLNLLQHFSPSMPRGDFRKGIRADQEIQDIPGASLGPQFLYRSDGITPFRSPIQQGWLQSRNIFAGEFDHAIPMLERSACAGFVRRIRGRNYQHFMDIELFSRRFRDG